MGAGGSQEGVGLNLNTFEKSVVSEEEKSLLVCTFLCEFSSTIVSRVLSAWLKQLFEDSSVKEKERFVEGGCKGSGSMG